MKKGLTCSQIIDAVWKVTDEVPDRSHVYIRIAEKLDLTASSLVRNVGYKLESENETNRFVY